MQEDDLKNCWKDFEKKEDLIASGDLPDDIHIWDRYFFLGHEVVHGYGNFGVNANYKCVKCKIEFTGNDVDIWAHDCPSCHTTDDVYQLNINRSSRWRCVQCKHEWDGEVGWKCPSCECLENPPRWTCKKCSYQWISEESNPCPNCQEPVY